ncbi:hypothetical protein ACFQY5_15040 [Paeniroseomonas aquatica]
MAVAKPSRWSAPRAMGAAGLSARTMVARPPSRAAACVASPARA